MDDAIEVYKEAESLVPEDSELKLDLAHLYAGNGQFAEALSTLQTIPQNRFPAAGIPVKAASLLALGRRSEAVKLAAGGKRFPAVENEFADIFLNRQLSYEN